MTKGKLIICGNHVGNILDVPQRSIDSIRKSDVVVCERYERFTVDIVENYDIGNNFILIDDLFDGSDSTKTSMIKDSLVNGKTVSFICDSGMPGFADYGLELIDFAYKNEIPVDIIPGPDVVGISVAAAALEPRGPSIIFDHYMGQSDSEIIKSLSQFVNIRATLVIIDLPHRMINLIKIANDIFGGSANAAYCSKVTTEEQKVIRGSLSSLLLNSEIEDRLDFASLVIAT